MSAHAVLDMCQGADCVSEATCVTADTMDGFLCLCPDGFSGDGRMSGTGCNPNQPGIYAMQLNSYYFHEKLYMQSIVNNV